jgi:hypothetical protein
MEEGQIFVNNFTESLLKQMNERFEFDKDDNQYIRTLLREQLTDFATKSVEMYNNYVQQMESTQTMNTNSMEEPKKKIKISLKKDMFK